jgi:hypothetical protein
VLSNTTTRVYPGSDHGPYVQQGCARGVVLRCTVVLAEGSYKQGGRGGEASRSLMFVEAKCQYPGCGRKRASAPLSVVLLQPGDHPLHLRAKGRRFIVMQRNSNCYIWRHGAQRRRIDGCPGESCSRRASWRVLYPSRSCFEGSSVGASCLVAVHTLTRGLGRRNIGGCTAAGVAVSRRLGLPQCRGWRCSAWNGGTVAGMAAQGRR